MEEISVRWKDSKCITVEVGEMIVEVRLRAATEPLKEEKLSECEADILQLLWQSQPNRLKRAMMTKALDERERFYGESTLGFALAALGIRGLIVMPGRGKRDGYAITPEGVKKAMEYGSVIAKE